jgi:hypothetical protein
MSDDIFELEASRFLCNLSHLQIGSEAVDVKLL